MNTTQRAKREIKLANIFIKKLNKLREFLREKLK